LDVKQHPHRPLARHPTDGRSFRVSGIDIFRIVDGKLVELWQEADTLGFLPQLGVIPVAEQSAG
jgi:predicted SnoaL-like aldol condensation-catalyzing enzyme